MASMMSPCSSGACASCRSTSPNEIDGGETVLDVGCGDGSIAQAIMALKPQLNFQGIDVLLRPQSRHSGDGL